MNSHDEGRILQYVHGELKGSELAELRDHLTLCIQCRAYLEEELALSKLLQAAAPLYSAPDELRVRVTAMLASAPRSRRSAEKGARTGEAVRRSWSWGARRWFPLLSAVFIGFICVAISRSILREIGARSYVEAAVTVHRGTLDGRFPPQILSGSPETVTRWVDRRVSFHFQLPVSQPVPQGTSRYRLVGARLIRLKGGTGVVITYHHQDQVVSLLVASAQTAVIAGGDQVPDDHLLFHFRMEGGLNVITWYNHGLAYALVSSVSGSARQSCLVCHGRLPAR
jgi:anti-sigma factor RsiW